jgi:hypothetical protein
MASGLTAAKSVVVNLASDRGREYIPARGPEAAGRRQGG